MKNDKDYARKIRTRLDAEWFCKNILFSDIPNSKLSSSHKEELENAIKDVLEQETLLRQLASEQSNTLKSQENRVSGYRDDEQRELLREKIAKQCLTQKRVPESKVTSTYGGMLPNTPLKKDKQFYFVIGLPASGKSSISERLADATGSVYLDADIVKRKLPEFTLDTRGASLVHLESNYILRPSNDLGDAPEYNIMVNCFQNGCNIVYNMIGDNYDWLKSMVETVKSMDYQVHLLLMGLDRVKCVKRAYNRFKETGRYLSLPLLFDVYANNPTISFFMAVTNNLVNSYAYIDNDVAPDEPKKIIINQFEDKNIIKEIAENKQKVKK